jgi:NTE family protein
VENIAAAEAVLLELQNDRPDVVELAELVSPAAFVETRLLRVARLELAPHLPTMVEADLWFSRLVESGDIQGFALDRDIAAILRRRLRAKPANAGRALALVREAHSSAPPTLQVEELIVWFSEFGDDDRHFVEQELGRVLVTMVNDADRESGLARWVERTLERLPVSARSSDLGRILDLAASTRLGRSSRIAGTTSPSVTAKLATVLPDTGSTIELGIRLFASGIEVSAPPPSGAHVIRTVGLTPITMFVAPADAGGDLTPLTVDDSGTGFVDLGRLTVWRGSARAFEIQHPGPLRAVALLTPQQPDAVAVASEDGTIGIYDLETASRLALLQIDGPVVGLAASLDGGRLISLDGLTIRLWDVATLHQLSSYVTGRPSTRLATDAAAQVIAFVTIDGEVRVLDGSAGEERSWTAVSEAASAIAVSARGDRVALASAATVHQLDLSGRVTGTKQFDDPIRDITFAPDDSGVALVAGSKVLLLNAPVGDLLTTLEHESEVLSAQYLPGARRIVTATEDRHATLWTVSGERVTTLDHSGPVVDAAAGARGVVVTASQVDRVEVHTLDRAVYVLSRERPREPGYEAASEIVDLVLEGVGIKFSAIVGAVLALTEHGYTVARVAGSGAGGIVAALLAACIQREQPLDRVAELIGAFDTARLIRSDSWLQQQAGRLRGRPDDASINANYAETWLEQGLESFGIRTFGDLRFRDVESAETSWRSRLLIAVADVTRSKLCLFPYELDRYGLSPERQSVASTAIMAWALPWYFLLPSLRHEAVVGGDEAPIEGVSKFCDAALLASTSVDIFDRTDGQLSGWPTIAIKVTSRECAMGPGVLGPMQHCVNAYLGMVERRHVDDQNVLARTIFVDTTGISPVDFSAGRETHAEMMEAGRLAVREFLAARRFEEALQEPMRPRRRTSRRAR